MIPDWDVEKVGKKAEKEGIIPIAICQNRVNFLLLDQMESWTQE
jgi:hypothetical protein